MAIPPTAVVWAESMDPSDILDFTVDCSPLLEISETINTYTVVPGPEASLLGLTVSSHSRSGNLIQVWLAVTNGVETAFVGQGVSLPVEFTINTSLGRRWQRTAVIKVAQK